MLRGIITALVAGTVVTSLTSTVYAQSDANYNTRSGESLQGIQNRSINKDFPTTFSGNSRTSGNAETLTLEENNNSGPQFKSPIRLPAFVNQLDFSSGGTSLNSEERFRLRYRVPLEGDSTPTQR
ncbi:MAG: hypothetical protein WBG73_02075 [Coleofasciculaceae cyanobacterium]